MIGISVKADTKEVLRHVKVTQKRILPRAQRIALNTTARKLRTQAVREISRRTGIKQKLIRPRVQFYRASNTRLEASLWRGAYLVSAWKAQPKRLGRIDAPLVAGKRQPADPGRAFIATMPSGHTGWYQRRGRKRLPIDELKIDLAPVADPILERLVKREGPAIYRRELEGYLRRMSNAAR